MRTLVMIASVLFCVAVWAQGEPVSQAQTYTVPVQKVAQLRQLTWSQQKQINDYLDAREVWLRKAGNYEATRAALEFLTRIDQSHFPLTRRPADYLADYQNFTQMLNRVDWYVTMQGLPLLPPVEPCPVPLLDLPQPELRLENVGVPAPCAVSYQPCRVGSVVIGRAGGYRETTIAGGAIWGGGGVCKPPGPCSDFPPSPVVPPPVPPPPLD